MNKSGVAGAALGVVGILALVGCGADAESLASPTSTVVQDASWAGDYSTMKDLRRAADAVVIGRVQGSDVAVKTELGPLSDASISVVRWIVAPAGRAPEEITVRQTGGVLDGTLFEVRDDPLLQPGETTLLYLRHDAANDVYVALGGPAGRFQVHEGKIRPMPGTPVKDAGTLTDVESVVRSASAAE